MKTSNFKTYTGPGSYLDRPLCPQATLMAGT